MPLTSPGNDDDTGENHQPTLRKNTAEPVEQTLKQNSVESDGFAELEWAPGSAQVDFGVARARIAGEMADVHCLVVSLPYSNMRLCVALPGENAECLCHGLMLVFEHIGGVPPVIVMDNATGAGRRNAKGEVALTGVFSAFVAHYRLEVRFCNPYSGHEKGAVESKVGMVRRKLFVPRPSVWSLENFSAGCATPGTCTQRSRPASTAPDRRSNTGNQARNDASAAPRRATARRPRRNRPAPRLDAIPDP